MPHPSKNMAKEKNQQNPNKQKQIDPSPQKKTPTYKQPQKHW